MPGACADCLARSKSGLNALRRGCQRAHAQLLTYAEAHQGFWRHGALCACRGLDSAGSETTVGFAGSSHRRGLATAIIAIMAHMPAAMPVEKLKKSACSPQRCCLLLQQCALPHIFSNSSLLILRSQGGAVGSRDGQPKQLYPGNQGILRGVWQAAEDVCHREICCSPLQRHVVGRRRYFWHALWL